MNRRQFLQWGSAGLAGLWLMRRALADSTVPSVVSLNGKSEPVAEAFARARVGHHGILVLVIPSDDSAVWQRGQVFGEWLNHGSDAQLAPLATVEVVAAKMADLRSQLPSLAAGEPLFVHIDAAGKATPLDVKVPSYPNSGRGGPSDAKQEDAVAQKRIAAVGGLIARSIPVDGDIVQLAAMARARLVKQRVPGSHWANASGCGSRVEGDEETMQPACGMGHVPSKSSRFLYLYSRTPAEQQRDAAKKGTSL